MPDPIVSTLKDHASRVESKLESFLSQQSKISKNLSEAIDYATFNGGKRLRPCLSYSTAVALNAPLELVDDIACAVELIHCYSLVHDDLPAMDDDDLRRGLATCHIKFDEATAILAGDAMQSLATEILSRNNPKLSSQQQLSILQLLSKASGPAGMAGGQALDLDAEGKSISLNHLERIHNHKTGALISFSIEAAAIACQASAPQKQALMCYGKAIGLAFQVHDDILDITASTEQLGKKQGADIELQKATYPQLLGLEGARLKAQGLIDEAIQDLAGFDDNAKQLRDIAYYIIGRGH